MDEDFILDLENLILSERSDEIEKAGRFMLSNTRGGKLIHAKCCARVEAYNNVLEHISFTKDNGKL